MSSSKALLLINLGSPNSPGVKDVQRYLNQFLMDPFVLDFPFLFRSILVRGLITPFRASRSAEAYAKIWREDGSPLIVLTQQLRDALQQHCPIPVSVAMRYGQPSIPEILEQIQQTHPHLEELIVLPLYPHYTMSSYETATEEVRKIHRKKKMASRLKFISPFYNDTGFVQAWAAQIKPFLAPGFDKLLFSYHGLPERHLRKDEERLQLRAKQTSANTIAYPPYSYREQCIETSHLIARELGLMQEQYETSFQSRLTQAGNKWIQPYTVQRLQHLPAEGVRNLLVVCPSFTNDCLETLEEIAMEGRHIFLEQGGTQFTYIPCLNNNPEWLNTIKEWIATP